MLSTEEFLQTTTEESLDDHLDPCPAGDWLCVAGKPEIKDFIFKSGDHEGEQGFRMTIRWAVQDDEPRQAVDRENLSVMQSVLLDVTPDGAGLDMGKGKNIGLGAIRSALGQNTPGAPWSPAMIEGQLAKLSIAAEIYKDRPQAVVKGVQAP
jgi:hypothetical protein